MKRLSRWLIRLYPMAWRARYGEEFQALLEEMDDRPFDVTKAALAERARGWRVPLAAVLGGIALGLLYWAAMPPVHEAKVQMKLRNPADARQRAIQAFNRRTLAETIVARDLYLEERRQQPMEDVLERMRRDIRLEVSPQAATVGFLHESPFVAERVARNLADALGGGDATETVAGRRSAWIPASWGGLAGLVGSLFLSARGRRQLRVAGTALLLCILASLAYPSSYRSEAVIRGAAVDPEVLAAAVASEVGESSRLRRGIEIEQVARGILRIAYRDRDRFRAQRAVALMLTSMDGVEVIDQPSLPHRTVGPAAFGHTVVRRLTGLHLP
ncbi:MAG: hypothetical protein SFV18_13860 [Bryobacteraceae bacterium]|nr:hypothetical protein [Bryobacteraceae bacterium]